MLESLPQVDKFDEIAKENWPWPMDCNFIALASLCNTCQTVKTASKMLTTWGHKHDKGMHTITTSDAFDVADEVKKNGLSVLDMDEKEFLAIAPQHFQASVMLFGHPVEETAAAAIQHALGHMMKLPKELVFLAHLNAVSGVVAFQHGLDLKLKDLVQRFDEPEHEPLWQHLNAMAIDATRLALSKETFEEQLKSILHSHMAMGTKMLPSEVQYVQLSKRAAEADSKTMQQLAEMLGLPIGQPPQSEGEQPEGEQPEGEQPEAEKDGGEPEQGNPFDSSEPPPMPDLSSPDFN